MSTRPSYPLQALILLATLSTAGACGNSCSNTVEPMPLTTDLGTADLGVTPDLSTPQDPSCSGIFDGACGVCLANACCRAVARCGLSQNCIACMASLPGRTDCAEDPDVTALSGCLRTSCAPQCLVGASRISPTCDAPAAAPSGGSCLATGGFIGCNPVTNAGCNAVAGEGCDVNRRGFECFPAPGRKQLCETCEDGQECGGGLKCVPSADGHRRCARYCCSDGDCGSGKCDKTLFTQGAGAVGVCLGGKGNLAPGPTGGDHCFSPPLSPGACGQCCAKAHAVAIPKLQAAVMSCACGPACAMYCGGLCGGTDGGVDSCRTCVGAALSAGTCDLGACTDPDCGAALRCVTGCAG